MERWRYHNPVDIRFGAGALGVLPSLTRGRRVTLVTFPEAKALGVIDRVRTILKADLVRVIDHTTPNPDVVELDMMYCDFWHDAASGEVLLAVGGGSVIDTAKALMVATADGSFAALVDLLAAAKPFSPARVRPLIAVPTTAGTGSEVTPWATIWDRGASRKYSLHLDSGLDALSHALESIWNVNANPVSDTHAVAAAREVLATLPALMRDRSSLALRTRMSQAALQAGLAFSNTKTALAHSISYDMTLHHGLPHGIACSFTLPLVLERALGVDPGRDAVLSRIFDGDLAGAPARLTNFLEGLGVSTRFETYGVSDTRRDQMIAAALDGVRGKNFIGARSAATA